MKKRRKKSRLSVSWELRPKETGRTRDVSMHWTLLRKKRTGKKRTRKKKAAG